MNDSGVANRECVVRSRSQDRQRVVTADANGVAVLDAVVPAVAAGRTLWFQALEHGRCVLSNSTVRTFF